MKPHLKAYILNTNCVDWTHESVQRGYLSESLTAENEHEARRLWLTKCYDYGVEETFLNERLTYINIKVKRQPESDKYLIDGKLKTIWEIEYDKRVKEFHEELDKLLADNPDGYAYIRKGGYYYRPNSSGYTEYVAQAGVYTLKQAVAEVRSCDYADNMRAILISVQEHNAMIADHINKLQKQLI